MEKYSFSPSERFAIYTTHGEKCYICHCPIDLKTMEVDHIIPESLLAEPDRFAKILKTYGRPEDFSVNSYSNWMPACKPCNGKKRATVFEPTLLFQLALQSADAKSADAKALEDETIGRSKIARALNLLQRANASGELSEHDRAQLQPLVAMMITHRAPDMAGKEIRLSPYVVLSEDRDMQLVKGPYGVGMRPKSHDAHVSWKCINCGSTAAWNGARCVICGQMDDE